MGEEVGKGIEWANWDPFSGCGVLFELEYEGERKISGGSFRKAGVVEEEEVDTSKEEASVRDGEWREVDATEGVRALNTNGWNKRLIVGGFHSS